MRPVAAALLAVAATFPAAADEAPPGWDAALASGAPVKVSVAPVEIVGGDLAPGLTFVGAWELSGDHSAFGGFSGLVVRGTRLLAVGDFGWWLDAELRRDGAALEMGDVRLAPMRGPDGRRYSKRGGDSEGLALTGEGLAVAFERDHRIMRLGADGRLDRAVAAPAFERLRSNKSLEGLATLPDDTLIVFSEGKARDGVPMFRLFPGGVVTERRLPLDGRHAVTGADLGPDGRLYLVLRDYTPVLGASIRVVRYALDADGWPRAETAEVLAAFEAASGIDNMEGISVEPGGDGGLHLWLISDDNFNPVQRTLLMLFALAE